MQLSRPKKVNNFISYIVIYSLFLRALFIVMIRLVNLDCKFLRILLSYLY